MSIVSAAAVLLATLAPPPHHAGQLRPLHLQPAPAAFRTRSCAAHVRGAGVIARKLAPVACEQPPRSSLAVVVLAGG